MNVNITDKDMNRAVIALERAADAAGMPHKFSWYAGNEFRGNSYELHAKDPNFNHPTVFKIGTSKREAFGRLISMRNILEILAPLAGDPRQPEPPRPFKDTRAAWCSLRYVHEKHGSKDPCPGLDEPLPKGYLRP